MNPCISVARDSGSDAKNSMVGSYEKAVKAKSRRLCFGQEAERSTCPIIGGGAQSIWLGIQWMRTGRLRGADR